MLSTWPFLTSSRQEPVFWNSAFNRLISALFQDKLSQLSVPDPTCRWITNFLSDREQHVKLGSKSLTTGPSTLAALFPLYSSPRTQTAATQVLNMSIWLILRMTQPSLGRYASPLPRTSADCNILSSTHRRWSVTICHRFRIYMATSHPKNKCFQTLPSGKKLCVIPQKLFLLLCCWLHEHFWMTPQNTVVCVCV